MNIFLRLCLLLSIIFLSGKPAFGADLSCRTALSATVATKYHANFPHERKLLRRIQDESASSCFFGRYRAIWALTAGYDFHFFPDSRFAITSWCDICGSDRTLLVGHYSRTGNAVKLRIEQRNDDRGTIYGHAGLSFQYGDISSLSFFVVAEKGAVDGSVLVPTHALNAKPIKIFLWRVVPY